MKIRYVNNFFLNFQSQTSNDYKQIIMICEIYLISYDKICINLSNFKII